MNETNVFWISLFTFLSVVALGTSITISSIGMPTEFSFNINITHDADNNTKAIYEMIEFTMKEELSDNCKVNTLYWNGSDFEQINGSNFEREE